MISPSQPILVRADKPAGTVILNRPGKRNAITGEMVGAISEALTDFHQQKSIRAVIITGSGDCFSSGTDLNEIDSKSKEDDALEIWHQDSLRFCELLEQMLRFPKPIIAALNGPVLGSAAALMLAADMVIAGRDSWLQFPEALRGLVPSHAAPLLAFRIGAGQAGRLLMSSEKIAAEEALRVGLFHELVESDFVWARASEIASTLQEGAPQSMLLTKQLMNETIGEELFTQLNIGAANAAAARTTDAATEGVQAFLEKRKPEWP